MRVMLWWKPLKVPYRSKHVRKLRKINDALMRYLISVKLNVLTVRRFDTCVEPAYVGSHTDGVKKETCQIH